MSNKIERAWDNLLADIQLFARDYYRYMINEEDDSSESKINDGFCVGQSKACIINRMNEIKNMYNEVDNENKRA